MKSSVLQRVGSLISKELLLDFKEKHVIYAIFLYMLTNVFVAYKTFIDIRPMIWNSLYVLIFLFVALNSILKSFSNRFNSRHLFYYSLYNPTELLISKVLYNFFFLVIISILMVFTLSFFSDVFPKDLRLMAVTILLGAFGFSVCFSFVALLSVKSGNSSTVFSILAIPLVVPILLLQVKINAVSLGLIIDSTISKDLWLLVGVDLLFMAVAIILFPLLWRE